MKKQSLLLAAVLAVGMLSAHPLDTAFLKGTCNRERAVFAPGEEIVFTLKLEGLSGALEPDRWQVDWKRSGDDGVTDGAIVPLKADESIVIRTRMEKPGFVRILAVVTDRDGKVYRKNMAIARKTVDGTIAQNPQELNDSRVFFGGGAGVDPDRIETLPEPADFDAFWERHRATLAKVPLTVERERVPGKENDVANVYRVKIACAGPRPVTGYLTIPKWADGVKTKCLGVRLRFDGYSVTSVQKPEKGDQKGIIIFHINAHGYELGCDASYYQSFYASIESNGKGYAFDPEQNGDPETAYFCGMTYRVMRALEYVKTLPEWNGKNLTVSGGSQGGLQSFWAAGLDPDVTDVYAGIPWGCDFGGEALGHNRGGWFAKGAAGLGYYDICHHARRIRKDCRVDIYRAGLGDYTCPPSGIWTLFRRLPCSAKRIHWVQGSTHGYVPPEPNQTFDVVMGEWK